jgi:DNA-directed RNA polymerase specialized sigma24 family protein
MQPFGGYKHDYIYSLKGILVEREDDVQLIYNILSGDDEAFNTLIQKHQKSVHALVWRKIGDFHHAEEITHSGNLPTFIGS